MTPNIDMTNDRISTEETVMARLSYDSNAGLRALRLRATTPKRGWRERIVPAAGEWDGEVRFQIDHKGHPTQEWVVWPPALLSREAQLSLYDMAAGRYDPPIGTEMADDPNDPPVVRLDILNQGNPLTRIMTHAPAWGFRGDPRQLAKQLVLHKRAERQRG